MGVLCESSAFLWCCCQTHSPSTQTPGLAPSFVLQGNGKCTNTLSDNGNLIHQHKSAPSLLAKRESTLQTPQPAQIAAQPLLCTVCCPCLSPADHMDMRCSQTAPVVSVLHLWKRWEQSLPDSPRIFSLTCLSLSTTFLPQAGPRVQALFTLHVHGTGQEQ